MFSGGGTGRPVRDGRLESEKAGSGSGRAKVDDTGCNVLDNGLLSGLAASAKGRSGGLEVNGEGRLWVGGSGAEGGGGA